MALVNVYQLHYRNGPAQGFGDYLRGCFCLYQIAKGLGMTFNMDMCNHPMSKYLENRTPPYQISYANVSRYFDANSSPFGLPSGFDTSVFCNVGIRWLIGGVVRIFN